MPDGPQAHIDELIKTIEQDHSEGVERDPSDRRPAAAASPEAVREIDRVAGIGYCGVLR